MSDEVLFGHEFNIVEDLADSLKIETSYGYQGYIKKEGFCEKPSFFYQCFTVRTSFADVYPSDDYLCKPRMTLLLDSLVYTVGETEGYYKIHLGNGELGYISKRSVKPPIRIFAPLGYKSNIAEGSGLREQVVKSAFSFYGIQYRWGGKSVLGIDCSGLVFTAYYRNGIVIFRDAKPGEYVKIIPYFSARAGDILYFEGHVALYLGNGRYIHANTESFDVCISSLEENDSLYSEKYKRKFLFAATVFK